jgi:peptidoglycan/LPS O-acetylase OafA/YrhL
VAVLDLTDGKHPSKSQRSASIDCLRAIAILWVLLYHFSGLAIFSKGTFGVLLFFIISGYCIAFSIESSQTAWLFYAKRLGRLLPALTICGFITTLFKYLAPELVEPGREMNWLSFFYMPFGMSTLNILQKPYILPDFSYWSLGVEFQFYVFCFLMMAIGLRERLIALLGVLIIFRTLSTSLDYSSSNDFFPFFLAGMGAAALVRGRTRQGIGGIVVAFSLELYHLKIGIKQPAVGLDIYRSLLLWAGTASVYLAGRYDNVLPRVFRVPAFFGLISYPLYLIHQDVGNMILRWAHVGIETTSDLLIRALVLPAFLMFVAWLVYAVVEKNTIKPLTALLSNPLVTLRQWWAAVALPRRQPPVSSVAQPDLPAG